MKRTFLFRCVRIIAVGTLVIFAASVSFSQGKAGQAPPPQPSPGGQPGGGRQPGNQPTFGDQTQPGGFPNSNRQQIYLSGSVRLSDGTIPPASVVIERVCGSVVRPEAYTDSKGNFSFMVGGQNPPVFEDASVQGSARMPSQQNGVDSRTLTGCQLRANLAGFISDSINIGFRQPLDDPEVGVIHIRRLDNVEGYTYSITTALAPKDAQKAYTKGLDDIKKAKWADAEKDLSKAVELYPKYAVAWYDLGRVYQQEQKPDDAARAYVEATKIDPKYISPYANLTTMAAAQQKWNDVDQYTMQLLKLNPYVAPDFYFYSAVANYNLHKIDLAEQRAREAAKLDPQHKIPRINHLLGVVLAQKGDYQPAAENMRLYLQYSPNATDASDVKEELAEIEKAIAEGH
jgi:Flp pilus assembly protein TadD